MAKILPTKLIPERITVKFNFADELEWGETLTLALSELEVVSGEDPNPNYVLRLQPVINGVEVSQQLRLGTAGVLYRLTIEATTSLGRTISKDANLAILPSDAIPPLPFGVGYSSALYPIEVVEGINADTFLPVSGFDYKIVVESIVSTFAVLSGVLADGITEFTAPTEAIDAGGFVVVSGVLADGITEFTAPIEAINASTFFPLSGTLVTTLISYTNGLPESIDSTFTVVSGTLT